MSLLLNMLSRLVITFLPRSKRLLISWLQSPSVVILELQVNSKGTQSYIYKYPFSSQTRLPPRLAHNTEQSSMWLYTRSLLVIHFKYSSVYIIIPKSVVHIYNGIFSSVHSLSLTLCDPMKRSTPGLPVHHQHPESTQTYVHRVSDAIQPSHPSSSPSPLPLNLSKHQGLFKWVSSSHEVAKVLEFQLQHQSYQWTPRTDLF